MSVISSPGVIFHSDFFLIPNSEGYAVCSCKSSFSFNEAWFSSSLCLPGHGYYAVIPGQLFCRIFFSLKFSGYLLIIGFILILWIQEYCIGGGVFFSVCRVRSCDLVSWWVIWLYPFVLVCSLTSLPV